MTQSPDFDEFHADLQAWEADRRASVLEEWHADADRYREQFFASDRFVRTPMPSDTGGTILLSVLIVVLMVSVYFALRIAL